MGVSSQNLGRAMHGPFFLCKSQSLGGQRGIALTEGALHQDAVDPAAVLEANGFEGPGQPEAAGTVQTDRSSVTGIAYDRDHLTLPKPGADIHQSAEQGPPDAASGRAGSDIDRVLHREPIGATRP